MFFLWVLLFLTLSCKSLCISSTGDPCRLDSGKEGVCRLISDCGSLKTESYQPQLCSFKNSSFKYPIVCCKENVALEKDRILPGDISRQKCNEYSALRFPENSIGRKPISERGEAERLQFPHMALLGAKKGNDTNIIWYCAGSIISDQYILTVGHCITNLYSAYPHFVMYGVSDMNDEKDQIIVKVKSLTVYPDYQKENVYDDIGLIQLEKKIEFNAKARPVCLNINPKLNILTATISHFGLIAPPDERTKKLSFVEVDIFKNGECETHYQNKPFSKGIQENSMICAGSLKNSRDSCKGDSGSPLQILKDNVTDAFVYELFGIVATGPRCRNVDVGVTLPPSIFTRVSSYVKWIEDIVWPEEK